MSLDVLESVQIVNGFLPNGWILRLKTVYES